MVSYLNFGSRRGLRWFGPFLRVIYLGYHRYAYHGAGLLTESLTAGLGSVALSSQLQVVFPTVSNVPSFGIRCSAAWHFSFYLSSV
jgi:hypothetical protein